MSGILKRLIARMSELGPAADDLAGFDAPGFDEAFYRAQLGADSAIVPDALEHYLLFGWRHGLDPSAGFSTSGYLRANPDVRAIDLNPLVHYLRYGMAEDRTDGRERREGRSVPLSGIALPGFDEGFYRAQLPNRGAAVLDALGHYLETGWREGLDPSAGFSTSVYLADNPDVAAAGLNPLVHFLEHGMLDGRACHRSRRATAPGAARSVA